MKFNKLITVAILLLSSLSVMAKKQHLDSIKIKNKFGKRVASQCTWQDRNGAHSKQITNVTIENGKTLKAKGPMLGYRIKEVTAMQSSLVASAAGSAMLLGGQAATGALIATFMGKTKARKNKYFVVTAGKKPKDAQDHVAIVKGYKNKATYKIHRRHIAFKKANKNLDLASEIDYDATTLQAIQDKFDKADAAYTAEDRAYFEALKKLKMLKNGPKKDAKSAKKDAKSARKAAIQKQKELKQEKKANKQEIKKQKKADKFQDGLDYLDADNYEDFDDSEY